MSRRLLVGVVLGLVASVLVVPSAGAQEDPPVYQYPWTVKAPEENFTTAPVHVVDAAGPQFPGTLQGPVNWDPGGTMHPGGLANVFADLPKYQGGGVVFIPAVTAGEVCFDLFAYDEDGGPEATVRVSFALKRLEPDPTNPGSYKGHANRGNEVQLFYGSGGSDQWCTYDRDQYFRGRDLIEGVPYRLTWEENHNNPETGPRAILGVSNINLPLYAPWEYDPSLVNLDGAGDPPGSYAPRLSCGRELRDMGNGQWFADAEAIVRNPDPEATDTPGEWRTSWSDDVYPGRQATIPLPPSASTDDDLFVSYFMRRESTEVIGWSGGESTGSEWHDGMEVHDGSPFPWTFPGWSMLVGGGEVKRHGAGWVTFDVDGDGVVGDPVPPEPFIETSEVGAGCTIRVSPVTAHRDASIVIIDLPDHMLDPNPPPAPGGGDSDGDGVDECADTGSRWNPFNWPEKMRCAFGGLLDGLVDLGGLIWDAIRWLWEKISGLFTAITFDWIPGLPDEWSGRFPLSVIAEAVGAFDALRDALQAGLDQPVSGASMDTGGGGGTTAVPTGSCGPSIDPNLDQLITLPGDSSGSKLDGLRVSLPVPYACPGQSAQLQEAADLKGMRTPIRGFLTLALYAGFFVRVASSFGPKPNGLEPGGMVDPKGGR